MEKLSALEVRVLGVLLEKELTTPDQYPLSLNALKLGCNQKSNRDPVLDLSDNVVQDTCNMLIRKRLLIEEGAGQGSRVNRYRHRFCNTEFSDLQLTEQELGLLCVLFLRGPQTPGELRSRSQRLCQFREVSEVELCLDNLAAREPPLVTRLQRLPGKREHRYLHLFSGEPTPEQRGDSSSSQNLVRPEETIRPTSSDNNPESDRITALENRVRELEENLAELTRRIDAGSD